MNARRAIITGASGHLGFHVARKLLQLGISTDLLVRKPNENIAALVDLGARAHQVDFRDLNGTLSLFSGADALFHLAAENTTDFSRGESVRRSTLDLTKTVLSASLAAAIPTIIYTSSVVVLGRSPDSKRLLKETDRTAIQESPYVEGKVAADLYCENLISNGQDIRRIYPSWVVGPGDPRGTPPHQLINQCVKKGQRFWFHGGLSLTSVEQVAAGHVNAWLRGQPGRQYLLGGANITFQEFFTILTELSGHKPPRIFLPKAAVVTAAAMLKAALRPFGKTGPIDPAYARALIGNYSWYDSSRAVQELGYEIPDVRQLLTEAVRLERKRIVGTYSLGRQVHPASASSTSTSEECPLLITGVPGWLGNRFVAALLNGLGSRLPSSRPVHLLIEPRLAGLVDLPPRFRIFPGDVRDKKVLAEALTGVGTVFHLAGAIFPPLTSTLYQVNFEGTRTLVDACIEHGVRRFLFMSTDSVCGHGTPEKRLFDENTLPAPYGDYGQSKHLAEEYIFARTASGEIDGTVLRGFWFFGPNPPPRQVGFLQMMRRPRQIVFGDGKNYRSISHVDNIVSAFFQAENEPRTFGKWYWIGDQKEDYQVDDIYRILCEAQGNRYRPIYIPGLVCIMMRGVGAIIRSLGRMHPTVFGIAKFNYDIAGSIAAAQRDFNYQPVTNLSEYAQELARDNAR